MKKRQIIIVLSAIGILALGILGKNLLASLKEAPERKKPEKTYRLVKVKEVNNDTLVKRIPVNGRLIATDKIEIYPEVTGTLRATGKPFKVGQHFEAGEVLLAIDGGESMLNLQAQRSAFINLISQTLPDIKIDHPESYDQWKAYLDALTPDKTLPEMPEVTSTKLKNLLSGRNVYQQYFLIKSQEDRQGKFTITAPFSGSVSMGYVNPGTVVRAGQKVGEFIRDGSFELEAAIPAADAYGVSRGDRLVLSASSLATPLEGKVTRIASHIDPATQRVSVYAQVEGANLREGSYLEGYIEESAVSGAIAINRNLVMDGQDGKYVFVVQDSLLAKRPVEVAHRYEQNVLVTGLKRGDLLLDQVVEGAYEGMLVKTENR